MKRQIEILAPAGSYEGMKAAMNAGCDAVYIGGSNFGARAFANNLDENTLLRAIDEAHIRDKKLYLTVNTLLKEKERTEQLYRFLEQFYLQGLDAVIVQDVGVLHFVHQNFPKLQIHASTQTTLTMAQGANLLKNYGVTRLVTARELSLKEIKAIRDNTDLEIETFVHGALCYCYSGQCLMSSMIGGRSGNRGRCAQPCRMPYQFHSGDKKLSQDKEQYLLSPKDINTLSILPELVEAGIDSFKIEGRMKRPEYAAAVSSMYRNYVDLYFELGKDSYNNYIKSDKFKKDMTELQDVYSRGGFSEGYAKNYNGKHMMSLYRPNHSGVLVGEVTDIKGSQVLIAVKETINAQDILDIRHKEEGYEFTVKDPHNIGELLRTNVGRRQDLNTKDTKGRGNQRSGSFEPVIHIGDSVYRTKNNKLLEQLAEDYMGKDRKLGIKGLLSAKRGEKLSLTLSYKDCIVSAYQDIVQDALKQPMTKEKLSAPIEKTGDTLYYFEELAVSYDDNIFVPVAWLNEIRREATSLLQEAVAHQYRRSKEALRKNNYGIIPTVAPGKKVTAKDSIGISLSVQTMEQFKLALTFVEVSAIYADFDTIDRGQFLYMADLVHESGKDFYIVLPHICRLDEYNRLKKDLLEIIEKEELKGFIIKNFEEIALLQSLMLDEKSKKKLILNHNMYIYNQESKLFWREMNITDFTAPVELNLQELRTLGMEDCEIIVYGYLPLMISAQCLFKSTEGCRKCKADKSSNKELIHKGYLTDRLGKNFFVQSNCNGCYNIIYNGQVLALHKLSEEISLLKPNKLRLDFTKETPEEMKKIVTTFIDIYHYGRKSTSELSDYTTGHMKRGVE